MGAKMTRSIEISALLLVPALMLTAAAAETARSSPPFVRDRNSSAMNATETTPYATDHVLVRLTRDGYERSALGALARRGDSVDGAATGLASLDAKANNLGVAKITRIFDPGADEGLAADLGLDRSFRFDVAAGTDVSALVTRLSADPDVEIAAPDRYAHLDYTPNDPAYASNWGHDNQAQLPGYDYFGTKDHTLPGTVGTAGFDADAVWNVQRRLIEYLPELGIFLRGHDKFRIDRADLMRCFFLKEMLNPL